MEETGNIWGEKCSGRQAAFCENPMVSYNERSMEETGNIWGGKCSGRQAAFCENPMVSYNERSG